MPSLISSRLHGRTRCPWRMPNRRYTTVKVTLVQALKLCTGRTARRGSRGIALPFHDQGTRRGRGQRHASAALYPRERPGNSLYRRLGGPKGRSGHVRKISPPTGIRSPDRPVSRYTEWATRPTYGIYRWIILKVLNYFWIVLQNLTTFW
jgi:hypothetical protein